MDYLSAWLNSVHVLHIWVEAVVDYLSAWLNSVANLGGRQ